MKRAIVLACLLGLLALVPVAHASPAPGKVRLGRVALTPPANSRSSLLVTATYPIALVGHRLDLRVWLFTGSTGLRVWRLRPLASGGTARSPERRRRFTFVHRIDLGPGLTAMAGGSLLQIVAKGVLDANRDGKAELASADTDIQETSGALGRAAALLDGPATPGPARPASPDDAPGLHRAASLEARPPAPPRQRPQ